MSDRVPIVAAAQARATLLYEGVRVPHRSCGVALAETFGLPTPSYQALRRGGITGEGPCGAIAAGMLVLGELLGDPDPAGPVTPALREAAPRYRAAIRARVSGDPDTSCNARTASLGAFTDTPRKASCTALAGHVAAAVAEVLLDLGHPVPLPPPPWEPPPR
ncbi:MAG: hypothetical protein RLZZ299_1362 [Pseudomonadota bacterium]